MRQREFQIKFPLFMSSLLGLKQIADPSRCVAAVLGIPQMVPCSKNIVQRPPLWKHQDFVSDALLYIFYVSIQCSRPLR